jgi:hypothetical protein
MSVLTAEEFTHLVLMAAAPPRRVGELVARLVGDHITIGPLAVGPAGIASATARGTRGQVHVTSCVDAYWTQIVTVPIALWIDVKLGKRTVGYRGTAEVKTRFRLRLDHPCTVTVEIEPLHAGLIRTVVEPITAQARLIGCVGGVDKTVAEQVLIYVRNLVASAAFEAAMHIDVVGLLERAWEADLVIPLPAP